MRPARASGLRRVLRNVLYLLSIGLAVHLILPQIAGLERSARLIATAAPALVAAAFLAEIASELCYAELMGRAAGSTSRVGTSSRRRRQRDLGRWFMFRLTVSGYGASHVLPGGGATAAGITYGVLKARGLDTKSIGLTLLTVTALAYGSLGVFFAASLLYLLVDQDLGLAATVAAGVFLTLTALGLVGSYAAYKRPRTVRNALVRLVRLTIRLFHIGGQQRTPKRAQRLVERLVRRAQEQGRALRLQVQHSPGEVARWGALAFGYWAFDALCLVLVFRALGVPSGTVELLVAYGVATAAGTLPLTPGGIGVFETTMLATLALLGVGAEAAVAILGYRLFNFWLPIPLAAIFYPTLHRRSERPGNASGG